eukprot:scaffold7407_cov69-Phaeocystis_antarctica.AAC.1
MTTRHEPKRSSNSKRRTSYTVKVKLKSALGRGKTARRYRLNSVPTRVKRCGATAQSALGWYRPSVGVPETFGGYYRFRTV